MKINAVHYDVYILKLVCTKIKRFQNLLPTHQHNGFQDSYKPFILSRIDSQLIFKTTWFLVQISLVQRIKWPLIRTNLIEEFAKSTKTNLRNPYKPLQTCSYPNSQANKSNTFPKPTEIQPKHSLSMVVILKTGLHRPWKLLASRIVVLMFSTTLNFPGASNMKWTQELSNANTS